MAPSELIRIVTEALNDLDIDYFITGSVASMAYGEVRDTADVDIVADIREHHVPPLGRAFSSDQYYLSVEAMQEAIRQHGQFNIVDSATGYKADIIVPASTAQNRNRFARALRLQLAGSNRTYWFSSPEDVILKKLEAHREGGSDKHLRDITGIMKSMGERLDRTYIDNWASQLGVSDLWIDICQRMS